MTTVRVATTEDEIRRCFPVMRELRPHITDVEDFLARVRRMQNEICWRLIYVEDGTEPVAAAGFRVMEYLVSGKTLYVDDLIALESHRGKGFAETLMRFMEQTARVEDCEMFSLDSATHRLGAHRFYHRLKMVIASFHFQKAL